MSDRIQLSQLGRGKKVRLAHHVYNVFNETKGHNVRVIQSTALTITDVRIESGQQHFVCRADSQVYTNDTLVFKEPDDVMIVEL